MGSSNSVVQCFRSILAIKSAWCLAVLIGLFVAGSARAELSLPMVLGDHMVLQRDASVPVWGTADPGALVVVRFASQSKQATADDTGRWRVDLDPMPANAAPQVLHVVSEGQAIQRTDVLIGEVWLCSGQSNMQMGLARAEDGEAEAGRANDPLLRLLRVENHVVPRGEDAVGRWAPASPDSAQRFSAAGYYFGNRLREELDVPVGLICSAWGATGVESWMPIEVIRDEPAFESTRQRDRIRERERPRMEAEYQAKLANWRTERDAAEATGKVLPKPPRQPVALRPQSQTGSLFDAMIHPLVPYAMRGAVWYQGETNVGQGDLYRKLLTGMVSAWRRAWTQDQFYFGIVQLPNYRPIATQPGESDWAELREAQRRVAYTLQDAGLAVTIDLGDAENGHPKNKRGVGERLASLILADVYQQSDAGHGPVLKNVVYQDHIAELTFATGSGELKSADGKPLGSFAVAGSDRQWHWAQAKIISPRTLHVWCPQVPAPTAVRYAWSDNPPSPNLTDDTGIPASPFQTDAPNSLLHE